MREITTTFVGLDAHKMSISVAMLIPGEGKPVEWQCTNDRASVRRMVKKVLQAVPLPVVHAALMLATARRTLRSSHLMPLPPVRTLHYFLPVIEEVLHSPPDPGYVEYLAGKLKPFANQKTALLAER
jgi:hypothetical protein